MNIRILKLVVCAVLLAGCNRDDINVSDRGTIELPVATIGDDIDPNGYIIVINPGGFGGAIESEQTLVIDLPADDYTVELTDVAENCTVLSENPVSVTLPAFTTITVEFNVLCEATGVG